MRARKDTNARAAELRAGFERAGAALIEPPLLQPAGPLLDLYGEDIRARAYVTSDALRGEQMLRPDFTVPLVQMHLAEGTQPARYTYAGEVFRRQEHDPSRANEYVQVGFEIFGAENAAAADAEVFARIEEVVRPLKLRAATGDIGILTAAVAGLTTTERRKTALMRHIWRPRRFRQLLDRFGGTRPMTAARAALLKAAVPLGTDVPMIGLRGREMILRRIDALRADAETPPIAARDIAALDTLLAIRDPLPVALEQLRDLAVDLPAIEPAVTALMHRTDALASQGIDVATLDFEASYGRTLMEYYDGFVFGFYAEERPDLPPVATGGRYDALTRRISAMGGQGAEMPAVGGVLRPDLILELESPS